MTKPVFFAVPWRESKTNFREMWLPQIIKGRKCVVIWSENPLSTKVKQALDQNTDF